MRSRSVVLVAAVALLTAVGVALWVWKPWVVPARQNPLVVSIEFDDGRPSQKTAGEMLAARGMAGTFFINSGNVGARGYLTKSDLQDLTAAGHEIGGHTVLHPDLPGLSPDELRREICDDRDTLIGWGFDVRNFAYPFGRPTPEAPDIVRQCGYNSARSLGDVHSFLGCQTCVHAETVPPLNPMSTRSPHQVELNWTAADIEKLVDDAQGTGGWLQLTFHGLCPPECSQIDVHKEVFEQFLNWLATKQADGSVVVRTVAQVVGGTEQPPVKAPVSPPAPPGVNALRNPDLGDVVDGEPVCWMHGGYGSNGRDFSLVPGGHDGGMASKLVVHDYVDGDAKLLQTTDLGMCAPSVVPGHTYTVSAWYTSTVPTAFSVQYRMPNGAWVFGKASPEFAPAADFTEATWTLPPIPDDVTAISFGLGLTRDGELVSDDYSLVEQGPSS